MSRVRDDQASSRLRQTLPNTFVGVSTDVVSDSLSQLTAPEDVHCGESEERWRIVTDALRAL